MFQQNLPMYFWVYITKIAQEEHKNVLLSLKLTGWGEIISIIGGVGKRIPLAEIVTLVYTKFTDYFIEVERHRGTKISRSRITVSKFIANGILVRS